MTAVDNAARFDERYAMTIEIRGDPPRVELNTIAARWFAVEAPTGLDEFRELGADVATPSASVPLGRYLVERLLVATPSAATELIHAGGDHLLASFAGTSCTLYAIAEPTAPTPDERERRHALRNQINTINMNAELIDVLAAKSGDARVRECAARIAEACRQAADTL